MYLWTPYADQPLDLRKTKLRSDSMSPTYQTSVCEDRMKSISPISYQPTVCEDRMKSISPVMYQPTVCEDRVKSISPVMYQPTVYEERIKSISPVMYQQTPCDDSIKSIISPVYKPTVCEDIKSEYRVYSPPSHETSPPGSINGLDTGFITEDPEYQEFERDALQSMAQNNGGSLINNNPRMRREIHSVQTADDEYRQQRERNNMAAKRSRDRRKIREVRLAIQVAYLTKKIREVKERLAERSLQDPYCRYGSI